MDKYVEVSVGEIGDCGSGRCIFTGEEPTGERFFPSVVLTVRNPEDLGTLRNIFSDRPNILYDRPRSARIVSHFDAYPYFKTIVGSARRTGVISSDIFAEVNRDFKKNSKKVASTPKVETPLPVRYRPGLKPFQKPAMVRFNLVPGNIGK